MPTPATTQQQYQVAQLSYQEQETVSRVRITVQGNYHAQLSYQEQETIRKAAYRDSLENARLSVNIVFIRFLGKAWLFDGNGFKEFASPPVALAWPAALPANGVLLLAGGMLQSLEVSEKTYAYGTEHYVFENNTAKHLLVIVTGADSKQVFSVLDDRGDTVLTARAGNIVVLAPGWKIVSRQRFTAVYIHV